MEKEAAEKLFESTDFSCYFSPHYNVIIIIQDIISLHLLTSKKVCISFIPGQGSEIKNLPSVRQTTLDFPSIFKEVLTYATPLLMVTLSPKRRLF